MDRFPYPAFRGPRPGGGPPVDHGRRGRPFIPGRRPAFRPPPPPRGFFRGTHRLNCYHDWDRHGSPSVACGPPPPLLRDPVVRPIMRPSLARHDKPPGQPPQPCLAQPPGMPPSAPVQHQPQMPAHPKVQNPVPVREAFPSPVSVTGVQVVMVPYAVTSTFPPQTNQHTNQHDVGQAMLPSSKHEILPADPHEAGMFKTAAPAPRPPLQGVIDRDGHRRSRDDVHRLDTESVSRTCRIIPLEADGFRHDPRSLELRSVLPICADLPLPQLRSVSVSGVPRHSASYQQLGQEMPNISLKVENWLQGRSYSEMPPSSQAPLTITRQKRKSRMARSDGDRLELLCQQYVLSDDSESSLSVNKVSAPVRTNRSTKSEPAAVVQKRLELLENSGFPEEEMRASPPALSSGGSLYSIYRESLSSLSSSSSVGAPRNEENLVGGSEGDVFHMYSKSVDSGGPDEEGESDSLLIGVETERTAKGQDMFEGEGTYLETAVCDEGDSNLTGNNGIDDCEKGKSIREDGVFKPAHNETSAEEDLCVKVNISNTEAEVQKDLSNLTQSTVTSCARRSKRIASNESRSSSGGKSRSSCASKTAQEQGANSVRLTAMDISGEAGDCAAQPSSQAGMICARHSSTPNSPERTGLGMFVPHTMCEEDDGGESGKRHIAFGGSASSSHNITARSCTSLYQSSKSSSSCASKAAQEQRANSVRLTSMEINGEAGDCAAQPSSQAGMVCARHSSATSSPERTSFGTSVSHTMCEEDDDGESGKRRIASGGSVSSSHSITARSCTSSYQGSAESDAMLGLLALRDSQPSLDNLLSPEKASDGLPCRTFGQQTPSEVLTQAVELARQQFYDQPGESGQGRRRLSMPPDGQRRRSKRLSDVTARMSNDWSSPASHAAEKCPLTEKELSPSPAKETADRGSHSSNENPSAGADSEEPVKECRGSPGTDETSKSGRDMCRKAKRARRCATSSETAGDQTDRHSADKEISQADSHKVVNKDQCGDESETTPTDDMEKPASSPSVLVQYRTDLDWSSVSSHLPLPAREMSRTMVGQSTFSVNALESHGQAVYSDDNDDTEKDRTYSPPAAEKEVSLKLHGKKLRKERKTSSEKSLSSSRKGQNIPEEKSDDNKSMSTKREQNKKGKLLSSQDRVGEEDMSTPRIMKRVSGKEKSLPPIDPADVPLGNEVEVSNVSNSLCLSEEQSLPGSAKKQPAKVSQLANRHLPQIFSFTSSATLADARSPPPQMVVETETATLAPGVSAELSTLPVASSDLESIEAECMQSEVRRLHRQAAAAQEAQRRVWRKIDNFHLKAMMSGKFRCRVCQKVYRGEQVWNHFRTKVYCLEHRRYIQKIYPEQSASWNCFFVAMSSDRRRTGSGVPQWFERVLIDCSLGDNSGCMNSKQLKSSPELSGEGSLKALNATNAILKSLQMTSNAASLPSLVLDPQLAASIGIDETCLKMMEEIGSLTSTNGQVSPGPRGLFSLSPLPHLTAGRLTQPNSNQLTPPNSNQLTPPNSNQLTQPIGSLPTVNGNLQMVANPPDVGVEVMMGDGKTCSGEGVSIAGLRMHSPTSSSDISQLDVSSLRTESYSEQTSRAAELPSFLTPHLLSSTHLNDEPSKERDSTSTSASTDLSSRSLSTHATHSTAATMATTSTSCLIAISPPSTTPPATNVPLSFSKIQLPEVADTISLCTVNHISTSSFRPPTPGNDIVMENMAVELRASSSPTQQSDRVRTEEDGCPSPVGKTPTASPNSLPTFTSPSRESNSQKSECELYASALLKNSSMSSEHSCHSPAVPDFLAEDLSMLKPLCPSCHKSCSKPLKFMRHLQSSVKKLDGHERWLYDTYNVDTWDPFLRTRYEECSLNDYPSWFLTELNQQLSLRRVSKLLSTSPLPDQSVFSIPSPARTSPCLSAGGLSSGWSSQTTVLSDAAAESAVPVALQPASLVSEQRVNLVCPVCNKHFSKERKLYRHLQNVAKKKDTHEQWLVERCGEAGLSSMINDTDGVQLPPWLVAEVSRQNTSKDAGAVPDSASKRKVSKSKRTSEKQHTENTRPVKETGRKMKRRYAADETSDVQSAKGSKSQTSSTVSLVSTQPLICSFCSKLCRQPEVLYRHLDHSVRAKDGHERWLKEKFGLSYEKAFTMRTLSSSSPLPQWFREEVKSLRDKPLPSTCVENHPPAIPEQSSTRQPGNDELTEVVCKTGIDKITTDLAEEEVPQPPAVVDLEAVHPELKLPLSEPGDSVLVQTENRPVPLSDDALPDPVDGTPDAEMEISIEKSDLTEIELTSADAASTDAGAVGLCEVVMQDLEDVEVGPEGVALPERVGEESSLGADMAVDAQEVTVSGDAEDGGKSCEQDIVPKAAEGDCTIDAEETGCDRAQMEQTDSQGDKKRKDQLQGDLQNGCDKGNEPSAAALTAGESVELSTLSPPLVAGGVPSGMNDKMVVSPPTKEQPPACLLCTQCFKRVKEAIDFYRHLMRGVNQRDGHEKWLFKRYTLTYPEAFTVSVGELRSGEVGFPDWFEDELRCQERWRSERTSEPFFYSQASSQRVARLSAGKSPLPRGPQVEREVRMERDSKGSTGAAIAPASSTACSGRRPSSSSDHALLCPVCFRTFKCAADFYSHLDKTVKRADGHDTWLKKAYNVYPHFRAFTVTPKLVMSGQANFPAWFRKEVVQQGNMRSGTRQNNHLFTTPSRTLSLTNVHSRGEQRAAPSSRHQTNIPQKAQPVPRRNSMRVETPQQRQHLNTSSQHQQASGSGRNLRKSISNQDLERELSVSRLTEPGSAVQKNHNFVCAVCFKKLNAALDFYGHLLKGSKRPDGHGTWLRETYSLSVTEAFVVSVADVAGGASYPAWFKKEQLRQQGWTSKGSSESGASSSVQQLETEIEQDPNPSDHVVEIHGRERGESTSTAAVESQTSVAGVSTSPGVERGADVCEAASATTAEVKTTAAAVDLVGGEKSDQSTSAANSHSSGKEEAEETRMQLPADVKRPSVPSQPLCSVCSKKFRLPVGFYDHLMKMCSCLDGHETWLQDTHGLPAKEAFSISSQDIATDRDFPAWFRKELLKQNLVLSAEEDELRPELSNEARPTSAAESDADNVLVSFISSSSSVKTVERPSAATEQEVACRGRDTVDRGGSVSSTSAVSLPTITTPFPSPVVSSKPKDRQQESENTRLVCPHCFKVLRHPLLFYEHLKKSTKQQDGHETWLWQTYTLSFADAFLSPPERPMDKATLPGWFKKELSHQAGLISTTDDKPLPTAPVTSTRQGTDGAVIDLSSTPAHSPSVERHQKALADTPSRRSSRSQLSGENQRRLERNLSPNECLRKQQLSPVGHILRREQRKRRAPDADSEMSGSPSKQTKLTESPVVTSPLVRKSSRLSLQGGKTSPSGVREQPVAHRKARCERGSSSSSSPSCANGASSSLPVGRRKLDRDWRKRSSLQRDSAGKIGESRCGGLKRSRVVDEDKGGDQGLVCDPPPKRARRPLQRHRRVLSTDAGKDNDRAVSEKPMEAVIPESEVTGTDTELAQNDLLPAEGGSSVSAQSCRIDSEVWLGSVAISSSSMVPPATNPHCQDGREAVASPLAMDSPGNCSLANADIAEKSSITIMEDVPCSEDIPFSSVLGVSSYEFDSSGKSVCLRGAVFSRETELTVELSAANRLVIIDVDYYPQLSPRQTFEKTAVWVVHGENSSWTVPVNSALLTTLAKKQMLAIECSNSLMWTLSRLHFVFPITTNFIIASEAESIRHFCDADYFDGRQVKLFDKQERQSAVTSLPS